MIFPVPVRPPAFRPPTFRQAEVLRTISALTRARGSPPTLEEICKAFGWASKQAALCHLAALESHGLICRTPRVARSVVLTQAGSSLVTSLEASP